MKFEVGEGTKSLVLKGYEIVDLSSAKDLDSIDISKSNKYISDNSVIYEKTHMEQKGKCYLCLKMLKCLVKPFW